MGTEPVLGVQDLNVHFGSSHILHGVDLTVDHVPLGLLGRNGMGKTTLCAAILGLVASSGGQILFKGEDITGLPPEARARRGIGYVPQGRRVFPSLTVEEHLRMMARSGSAWPLERIYTTFPRLKERRRNLGNRLSGGEQQMLAIGRALMRDPQLLVLDEPTEGLAPAIVNDVINLIADLSRSGMAILMVEQNLHAALSSTREVAIMVNGRVVDTLPADRLGADPDLQRRHLGIEPWRPETEATQA